ncbi:MAG: acetate--CoA ligase family protein, partial [Pseudomonadota bacterium]
SRPGAHRAARDLPAPPDAAFLAVNRSETVAAMAELTAIGAGGAVCFAAGFAERATEEPEAGALAQALDAAAGPTPYLGPNCYGLINYFDRVALWPDQVVPQRWPRGVAVLAQSGTLSITLMSQRRSLPLGYVITLGNQQRLGAEDLIFALLEDARVSAIGLYLETVRDLPRFVAAAEAARAAAVPIALIKVGRSERARAQAFGHTGALTGPDALYDALFARLGAARAHTLSELIETLKLLHAHGPAPRADLALRAPSGGDMTMAAEQAAAAGAPLRFAEIPPETAARLRAAADGAPAAPAAAARAPFDMGTASWFDRPRLSAQFDAMLSLGAGLTGFMLDPPDAAGVDVADYDLPIAAYLEAAAAAGPAARAALISHLPESLSPAIRAACARAGVAALQGLPEAMAAAAAAARIGAAWAEPDPPALRDPTARAPGRALDEAAAKARLRAIGLTTPAGGVARSVEEAVALAAALPSARAVVKMLDAALAHKTERGGVALRLEGADAVARAAKRMLERAGAVLVEEMIEDGVAELLIGVARTPGFGLTLTLGAGGVRAEEADDAAATPAPFTRRAAARALSGLRAARALEGRRGRPTADVAAALDAVDALERALAAPAAAAAVDLLEINP